MLGVDENDELIDTRKEDGADYGAKLSFPKPVEFIGVRFVAARPSFRKAKERYENVRKMWHETDTFGSDNVLSDPIGNAR